MTGTNVPPVTYTPAGFVAPTEQAVLAGVQADIQAAFAPLLPPGVTLNFTTSSGSITNPTPQGALAESLAAIITAMNDLFLLYASLMDPALTYGRMQDAIGRIYYIFRNAGQSTVATCGCIGLPTTVIPAGSVLQDGNGVLLTTLVGGVISSGGTVNVDFQANIPGPVTIASPLTPVSSIPGWDTVTLSSQVSGTTTETSQQFEARRSQSTALNGAGFVASINGAIRSVPGVLDAFVTENATGGSVTVGGVVLAPYSLYVCVLGGLATDVAQAIWSRKNPGTVYNGTTSATVYDTQSGYQPPYPAYLVSWYYATQVPFAVVVTITNDTNVPSNAVTLVQNGIVSAFAGADVIGYTSTGQALIGPRARIASTLYASRFIDTIKNLWTSPNIITIKLASTNTTASQFTASVSGTTMTVTGVTSGTIAVGQVLLDASNMITPGTKVSALGTGSGGVGTYYLSISQTVSSGLISGVVVNLDDVPMNLNQVPSVASGNVFLVFA